MSPLTKRRLITYASFAVILLVIYFCNTAIQTHLGRKALKETGLAHHDLNTALNLAQSQSKWVLADLSAIWCPSCRKLDQRIFSDKEVQNAIEQQFVFARIEYESDEGKAFKKAYKVSGFPTLLILDAKGKLIQQLPLTFDPQAFIKNLQGSLNKGS